MKKLLLVVSFCLLIIAGAGLAWELSGGITGEVVLYEHSYTKAICEGTFCQDYEVICLGGELVEMIPFENAWVVHEDGWVDFRVDVGLC